MPRSVLYRLRASHEGEPRNKIEPLQIIFLLCLFTFHPWLSHASSPRKISDESFPRKAHAAAAHDLCASATRVQVPFICSHTAHDHTHYKGALAYATRAGACACISTRACLRVSLCACACACVPLLLSQRQQHEVKSKERPCGPEFPITVVRGGGSCVSENVVFCDIPRFVGFRVPAAPPARAAQSCESWESRACGKYYTSAPLPRGP